MFQIGHIVRINDASIDSGSTLGLVVGQNMSELEIAPILEMNLPFKSKDEFLPIGKNDLNSGKLDKLGLVSALKVLWADGKKCQVIGSVSQTFADKVLRLQSKLAVRKYYEFAHEPDQKAFIPGVSSVPVSGRVYGAEEMQNLMESTLDFWLTTGRFNDAFEKSFAKYLSVKHVLTTNSGSSANLLAVSALTSPKLGERRLKPGDEIITVAAAFPTTVNPIIQNELIPVFVDVDIPTYNIKSEMLEAAVGKKTRAIVLAHTLGNPFNVNQVLRIAQKYSLWVIEDCCDALGSTYTVTAPTLLSEEGKSQGEFSKSQLCGTFGHIATFSFYPAHHMTMGEGGAVATNDPRLKKIIESIRDWGRDCWCPPGHDETCKRRFDWKLGDLPHGYDHKYIYSHVGYNLKITDMQAGIGLAQMNRLEEFIQTRQRNFDLLYDGLKKLEDNVILPESTTNSVPSWFGFPITLKKSTKISREHLLHYLNERKIGTRLLFGGNLIRQPYMRERKYRIIGKLDNTDVIMRKTFWLGLYPGLSEKHIDYMLSNIEVFFSGKV